MQEGQVTIEGESLPLPEPFLVLADFELAPRPIHIVYPEARLVPARTRLFIDWIKRHIASQAPLWEPRALKPHAVRPS